MQTIYSSTGSTNTSTQTTHAIHVDISLQLLVHVFELFWISTEFTRLIDKLPD